jgi:predicted ATPase
MAIEAARAVAHNFPDGVWFVDLAPLADLRLVPQTVATALGLVETGGRSFAEQIVTALGERCTLLVLDNCEHLVAACAKLVSTLLRSCSGLTIVATSREPLAVAGEHVYPVPPLLLPPTDVPAATTDEVAALSGYAAVQLFVDRAMAVQPRFALTAANAEAVARICLRLDGLPLAIDLAAARVRVLAPEQIAVRLDDRFRLLSGGTGSPPPVIRHCAACSSGATNC